MTRDQADHILRQSIDRLRCDDEILLENNVAERAVTHRLAMYLEDALPPLRLALPPGVDRIHVDCEYNRNREEGIGEPKRLQRIEQVAREILESGLWSEEVRRSVTTYPDIIVHHRGTNNCNLLMIEIKMSTNPTKRDLDIAKLKAFTEPPGPNRYCYAYGVFILLGAGHRFREEPQFRWFRNGNEV